MTKIILPNKIWVFEELKTHLNSIGFNLERTDPALNYLKPEVKEESLMTREEAINIVTDINHNQNVNYWGEEKVISEKFIKVLEALGLIKFKEEKKRFEFYDWQNDKILTTNSASEAAEWLHLGYKVNRDNG